MTLEKGEARQKGTEVVRSRGGPSRTKMEVVRGKRKTSEERDVDGKREGQPGKGVRYGGKHMV